MCCWVPLETYGWVWNFNEIVPQRKADDAVPLVYAKTLRISPEENMRLGVAALYLFPDVTTTLAEVFCVMFFATTVMFEPVDVAPMNVTASSTSILLLPLAMTGPVTPVPSRIAGEPDVSPTRKLLGALTVKNSYASAASWFEMPVR